MSTRKRQEFGSHNGPNGLVFKLGPDLLWVFNLAFSGFSVAMFLFWALYMRNNPSESSDKLLLIFSSLVSLAFVLFGISSKKFRNNSLLIIFAVTSLTFGIAIKENQNMSREHVMGFGLSVLLLSILVLIGLMKFMVNSNKFIVISLTIYSLFLVFLASISFFQDRNSLIESQHSEYVVNELVAPYAGKILYQDFVPQYSFSLAYLFALLPKGISYIQLIDIVIYFLTFTAFLSLLIAIFLGMKLFKSRKQGLLLAIIVIIPLTSVTAGWGRTTFVGPPTTLLSGPSIRIFVGMALALLLYLILRRRIGGGRGIHWSSLILLGFSSGLSSSINLDFGLAASVSMLATVVILGFKSIKFSIRNGANFLFGFILYWTILISYLESRNSSPSIELFGWFIRQFGGGFGSVPISYPGPVMFALPTIFALCVFYSLSLTRHIFDEVKEESDSLSSALGVLTFVSIWTFLSLPYYLNRSYHSGQMSTLYLPLSLSILGLLAYLAQRVGSFKKLKISSLLPLLIVSIAVASVWISPNPNIEIKRIRNLNPDGELPRQEVRDFIKQSPQLSENLSKEYKSFAYFGEEGNIVELATGVKSANIFNNPLDLFQSNNSIELGCSYLDQLNVEALIMTTNGSAAFLWSDGSLCAGKYKKVGKEGTFEIAEKFIP